MKIHLDINQITIIYDSLYKAKVNLEEFYKNNRKDEEILPQTERYDVDGMDFENYDSCDALFLTVEHYLLNSVIQIISQKLKELSAVNNKYPIGTKETSLNYIINKVKNGYRIF